MKLLLPISSTFRNLKQHMCENKRWNRILIANEILHISLTIFLPLQLRQFLNYFRWLRRVNEDTNFSRNSIISMASKYPFALDRAGHFAQEAMLATTAVVVFKNRCAKGNTIYVEEIWLSVISFRCCNARRGQPGLPTSSIYFHRRRRDPHRERERAHNGWPPRVTFCSCSSHGRRESHRCVAFVGNAPLSRDYYASSLFLPSFLTLFFTLLKFFQSFEIVPFFFLNNRFKILFETLS